MAVVAQGVDYAFSHPSIASLVANGKTFAVRYVYPFSQNPGTKNLTRVEADQLNAALTHGVVSNFESYASRAGEGFAAGAADARSADAQHRACGGPPTRPIYFSVDYDADPATVADYFRGVISVIGLARTGAYGSYRVIKYLFDHHLITWGWGTYAWSAGQFDERCQLAQDKLDVPMGGGTVDLDSAHAADFGQWKHKGTPGGDDDMTPEDWTKMSTLIDQRLNQYFANGEGNPKTGRIAQAVGLQLVARNVAQKTDVPTAAQNAAAVKVVLPPAGPGGAAPDYESVPVTITLTPKAPPSTAAQSGES